MGIGAPRREERKDLPGGSFLLTVVITPEAVPFLHRRFLGLTFFERRLREAKRFGARHVYVEAPGSDTPVFPRCTERRCAPWSFVGTAGGPADGPLPNYRVPLLGLVKKQAPFDVEYEIHDAADWAGARKAFCTKIIHESGAGWVALHINKPISFALSRRLAETSLTPNMWSVFNLLVGLLSGYCVAQTSWGLTILGGLLFQLASVFDGVDGEIAKFRLEYSDFGAKLDTFVDNTSLLAFLVGAFAHWLRSGNPGSLAIIVVPAISVVLLLVLMGLLFMFVHQKLNAGSLVAYDKHFLDLLPRTDHIVRLSQSGRYFIKKDFFSMGFFLLCVMNRVELVFYAVMIGAFMGTLAVLYLNNRYGETAYVSPAA